MISPTGRQHRLVLTKQNGVYNPYAVHFDPARSILLVANKFGESVVVFKKDRKEAKREKEFGNDLDGATYY
jgi:6-phosphogluconolactonase (cycloisomerase 2 family)